MDTMFVTSALPVTVAVRPEIPDAFRARLNVADEPIAPETRVAVDPPLLPTAVKAPAARLAAWTGSEKLRVSKLPSLSQTPEVTTGLPLAGGNGKDVLPGEPPVCGHRHELDEALLSDGVREGRSHGARRGGGSGVAELDAREAERPLEAVD